MANLAKTLRSGITKHSPEILTGIGIAGMVTTTILAVKVTPKATELINMELARQNRELINQAADEGYENCHQLSKLKPIDIVKTTWKCYIPAAITGAASITCLIGASSVSLKRNAALTAVYKISETALSEYRNAVVETIGEKKEQAVRDTQAKNKLRDNPVSNSEIIITGKGHTRCFESLSGRYFESDIDTIKKVQNELNRTLLNEMYISLNDLYDALGLKHTDIGYDLGWSSDNGLIDIHFRSHLDEDGVPCLVLDYDTPPKYGYSSLY